MTVSNVLFDAGQAAAGERCLAQPFGELRFGHRLPRFRSCGQRIEHGIEGRVGVERSLPIVRTAALTCVASEDPAVQIDLRRRFAFDGMTGDAAVRVDDLRRDDGPRRAVLHAGAARPASRPFERRVVSIGFVAEEQLAQQHERTVLRRDQERLPPDPAQTGLDGQSLFGSGAASTKARPSKFGCRSRKAANSRCSIS